MLNIFYIMLFIINFMYTSFNLNRKIMTAQVKRPLVFLTIDLFTFSSYFLLILYFDKALINSFGELPFWSTSILLLIPLIIVSRVILYVLYSIFNTISTREREDKFLIDELGKTIRLKASRNFNTTFTLGFVIAMLVLAAGASISLMFTLFFCAIFAAFIVQNVSEYYYTKKGS